MRTRRAGSELMRTIPLGHGDADATVDEIQRMWPQLRKNPLQVVPPSSAVSPLLRQPNGKKSLPEEPPPRPSGAT